MNPCLKREVCAVIINSSGEIVVGQNTITATINKCPREKGEGYDKCLSICKQRAHAEVDAILKAEDRGMDIRGATLYLIGHHRVCNECQQICELKGLNIKILGDKP